MPIEGGYAHMNMLQMFWGYDIPIAVAYTARHPFPPDRTPLNGTQWTDDDGKWLRDHQVSMILFPYHDEDRIREYADWIRNAKAAVPGVIILDKNAIPQ